MDVREQDFEGVEACLAELLGLIPKTLEQGVLDTAHVEGFRSTAIDRTQRFLAARWLQSGQLCELFCVAPASKPAQMGYSVFSGEGAEPVLPVGLRRWMDPAQHRTQKRLPSFTSLACLLATQGASARDVGEREPQLEAECDYLKQLLAEQTGLLRETQTQLRHARRQHSVLAPVEDESTLAIEQADVGWPLEVLPDWCSRHEDEVVVLSRARNGVKKSIYEDPSLICTALELLAGPYRDFRRGLLTKDEFEDLMNPTGLRLAGSVSPTVAGEQGEAYFVSWAGRRRFLEFHLLKGGGRDERYCFRLYFFWDDVTERVVVGSMPAHLNCSLS